MRKRWRRCARLCARRRAFAGMEVLTYCFMSNHFHIFVRLGSKETEQLDDAGGWGVSLGRVSGSGFGALSGSKK